MTKNKIQRLLAILCAAAAAFCMVLGFINMPKQNGAAGQEILRTMRIQTLKVRDDLKGATCEEKAIKSEAAL